jgi:hypothetical protein
MAVMGCLLVGCARPSPRVERPEPPPAIPTNDRPTVDEGLVADSARVAGMVVHVQTQQPLARALVILRCSPGAAVEQQTDERGGFAFLDVSPGACTIQVLSGHGNASFPVRVRPDPGRTLELAIDPEAKFRIDLSSFHGEVN